MARRQPPKAVRFVKAVGQILCYDAPLVRQRVEGEARARRAEILSDLPATLRRILRKQLIIGDCSMDKVAAMLGIHRRTLDRHLLEHGVRYGELLESVKDDVARQLLRDTDLQVQRIAEALHFSSAANFATAPRGVAFDIWPPVFEYTSVSSTRTFTLRPLASTWSRPPKPMS